MEKLRKQIFEDYAVTAFSTSTPGNPPKRFELGEGEINLKPGTSPVNQRMFNIQGERREAWLKLCDKLIEEEKWEDAISPWSSPSFPVAKKEPGSYRLVVDFRAVNDATIADSYPLPLINDVLQKHGKFNIHSAFDMKDGFHQVPLKKEHRYITAMSTPRGTKQWKVIVMGLKNSGAQFQRVMEKILEGIDCASVYIDDILVSSTGSTEEEALANHDRDIRIVLDRLAKYQMFANPNKTHLFLREVEFLGHVLRDGKTYPSPGKLLSIQKWELAADYHPVSRIPWGCRIITSAYIPHYAEHAGPLSEKLKVNRHDGKKGILYRS